MAPYPSSSDSTIGEFLTAFDDPQTFHENLVTAADLVDSFPQENLVTAADLVDSFPQENLVTAADLVDSFPQENLVTAANLMSDFPQENLVTAANLMSDFPQENLVTAADLVDSFPEKNLVTAANLMSSFPQEKIMTTADLMNDFSRDIYPTLHTVSEILSQYPDFAPIVPDIARATTPKSDTANPTKPSTTQYHEHPVEPSWISEITGTITCQIVALTFTAIEKKNEGLALSQQDKDRIMLALCVTVVIGSEVGMYSLPTTQLANIAGLYTISRVLSSD